MLAFQDWLRIYQERLIDAGSALRQVLREGARIFLGGCCGEPQHLTRELIQVIPAYGDLELVQILSLGELPDDWSELQRHCRLRTYFVGPRTRDAVNNGLADYIPIYLSSIPKLLREGGHSVDVALIQVSPPDEHGFCSLGIGVDVNKTAADCARVVVAQVNRLTTGSPERAIPLFMKAFKLNRGYYDALYNLANAFEKKGHYHSAIWFYEVIIKRKPRSPEIHNNRGVVYQKRGQFDLAREHFSKTIIIDPDNLEARNNLGVFYNSQGRYNEAIAEFKQAQRIKPDFAEVYSNLGMVYSGMGQYDSAIDEFQKALRIKPKSAETMNNIGNAYKGKGEYDRAIEAFNKTLEINPNLAIPHLNLAIVYLYQKKDSEKALYHFEGVLEREPGFPKAAGIRKKIEELKKEQQN